MKSLSFKKVLYEQLHIYISQLIMSLFFYKLLLQVKKIDLRLNKTLKLKLVLMFFDSVYPTRPSDNVTKYFISATMASKTWLQIVLHITFCDRIFLEFVSKNPPFLSRPSDTKIQIAIISW